MGFLDKLRGWLGPKPPPASATPTPARWIPADRSPFGVRVLDLVSITGNLISTSKDPREAERSMSWDRRLVAELPAEPMPARAVPCELRYPADPELQDGWLFCPSRMEEKWAIALRQGRLLLLRSWTGELAAVGETRRDGADLVVDRLRLGEPSLDLLGEPIPAFDWLLRTHALGEDLPLPVSRDGAGVLEAVPLSVFSVHGCVARYAAVGWNPPPPSRPLRATSDLVTAVRLGDAARVAALAARGCSVNARSPILGYAPLHVAAAVGSVELARQLLDLGADPNLLADRGASAATVAVVHKAPPELLQLLAARGADLRLANEDGFGLLHALAEVDATAPLAWLVAQGLDLEARTRHGHTALHIAAALGHVDALDALLDAGADPGATSPGGTPREVAVAQGKGASVEALDARAQGRRS